MRVLVNYDKEDKQHLAGLAYVLRNNGIEALSSSADMTIGELLGKATGASCDAILLSNAQTLRYCVPGEAPTVDKWRGSRLNFSVPTIVINKIAHLHTVNHGEWLLNQDVAKLKWIRKKAKIFVFHKLTKTSYFKDAYDDLRNAVAIYYDVETRTYSGATDLIAGHTVITCASWTGIFLDGSMRTYVLPFINFTETHWDSDQDYAKAILLLKRINALPMTKAMHNGMYDATHSIRYHAPLINWTYDTMAMAHAEFAELPKTIDFVASYLLYDYIYWKDAAADATKKKDIEGYWAYNGKDTWFGARIMIEQLRNSPEYAVKNYANKFKLVYPSLYCNFEGLLIDQPKREELRAASLISLKGSEERLRVKFADPNFNPGSWQQVEKYIYKVFGANKPGIGKSKSGTDEKNLVVVGEQHPLLARLTTDILDYRGAQKAIGTYYDFLQFKGRLLWALNPFGTETERMACSASSLWCGTQIQNIPSYAKGMLIADPGFELFEGDFKQAEGRTTAYCSQDEALIAALEDATKDFYRTLGTLFFEIPYENVSDFFRNKVLKKIVHGTNYMMGAKTFIENIGIMILYETADKIGAKIVQTVRKNRANEYTLKGFATMLLESYHRPFNKIRPWYQTIKQEISLTGYLVSPVGHTRKFFGNINTNHNILRGAVAHQPQNLSGEVLNRGFLRVYNELVLPGAGSIRLKAQIHDSIFGQWRIEKRDYYAQRVIECMDNPIVVHGRTMRIPVDLKYGNRWEEQGYEKDKIINMDGTRKWKGPSYAVANL
jgi:DNA polymerase I-like protein with 3'-5' exonuclease and polymerase domains